MMLATEDAPITDEIIDEEILFFIKRKREATIMYELMAESFWQYKLRQKSIITYSDSDSKIK